MKYQMIIHVFVDRALKTGCMLRSDTPKRLRVVNEANRSGDREEDENEDESEGVDDILDEKVY